jgi:hypothetical protein
MNESFAEVLSHIVPLCNGKSGTPSVNILMELIKRAQTHTDVSTPSSPEWAPKFGEMTKSFALIWQTMGKFE